MGTDEVGTDSDKSRVFVFCLHRRSASKCRRKFRSLDCNLSLLVFSTDGDDSPPSGVRDLYALGRPLFSSLPAFTGGLMKQLSRSSRILPLPKNRTESSYILFECHSNPNPRWLHVFGTQLLFAPISEPHLPGRLIRQIGIPPNPCIAHHRGPITISTPPTPP